EAIGVGNSLLLHVSDRAVGEYWRALVGVRGRLVTVSASGAEGAPLDPAAGRKLLDATLIALEGANPAAAATP
ncbi:MAG: cation transport ATPase, partial [Paracoccaceae bacterium]